jgi:hypothetical protein
LLLFPRCDARQLSRSHSCISRLSRLKAFG